MKRRKTDKLIHENLLPIDGETVAMFWDEIKTMMTRIERCKDFAIENARSSDNPAAWAYVVEILEGRGK
jgi:hypothetical protein